MKLRLGATLLVVVLAALVTTLFVAYDRSESEPEAQEHRAGCSYSQDLGAVESRAELDEHGNLISATTTVIATPQGWVEDCP
jgi:hypothetical protein